MHSEIKTDENAFKRHLLRRRDIKFKQLFFLYTLNYAYIIIIFMNLKS